MKRIKQVTKIILISIFLSSCSSSIEEEVPKINSEETIYESSNSEKKRMEIV